MSPSRRRAPRGGVRASVLALFVALAAPVSLLVPTAAATYPGPGARAPIDSVLAPVAVPEPIVSNPNPPGSPDTLPDRFPLYPLVAPVMGPGNPGQALLAPYSESSPHMSYSLTTDSCAACHRAHTAQSTILLAEAAPQAALCFTCHNGAGSSLAVQAGFTSSGGVPIPADVPATSSYYAHPATVDLNHAPGQVDEFGGTLERHATCTDCHDSHRADGTPAVASGAGWSASGAIIGASGVSVVNRSAGLAPFYTLVKGLSFEYQLCFKCHTGWTELPAQDAARPSTWALDKGIELNPANGAYHPIEAPGKNVTAAMAASLAGGTLWQFSVGDTIRCVNCHGDPAKAQPGDTTGPDARLAPHASTERGLLIAPYRDRLLTSSGVGYQGTDFRLCFLCHSATPFTATSSGATNFDLHARHVSGIPNWGSGGTDIDSSGDGQGNAICAECHFRLHSTALAVKPGDVNNARLVNFAPNVLPRSGVLRWVGGASESCTLTCHSVSHRAAGYEPAAVQNAALGVNARISIAGSGTSLVGNERSFTVTVDENDGTGGGWVPAVGIAVSPSEVGVGSITGGTCNNSAPDTNASGQCTIIIDSPAAGTSTVDATATVEVEGVVGPVSIDVSTAGSSASATWVDARISVAANGTNRVSAPHTFTITVEKNLGLGGGWVAAAGVTVTGSESGVGSIDLAASTCDDTATDGIGECQIVVTSSAAGQSTVQASATVNVSGVSIDVATNGYGTSVVQNLATWVDARITIGTSGTNPVDTAHTFTVFLEKNDGTGWADANAVTINSTASGIGAITGGTCGPTGATGAGGTCTIIVNSSSAGSSTVDASGTVSVGGVSIDVSTSGYGAHDIDNTKTWEPPPPP